MPRRTYGEGYDDGYEDAMREHEAKGVKEDVGRTLRKLRMGYTLDVTFREFLEDLERRFND